VATVPNRRRCWYSGKFAKKTRQKIISNQSIVRAYKPLSNVRAKKGWNEEDEHKDYSMKVFF